MDLTNLLTVDSYVGERINGEQNISDVGVNDIVSVTLFQLLDNRILDERINNQDSDIHANEMNRRNSVIQIIKVNIPALKFSSGGKI